MDKRKGQEEMAGFVLIVLVVAVIFLIVLGIYARKPVDIGQKTSGEAYYFLESMMETTTSCISGYSPNYLKVGDLIEKCLEDMKFRSNTNCLSGEKVCSAVNSTLNEIFENSLNVGVSASVKGYVFESKTEDTKLSLNKGVCGFSRVGAEYSLADIKHSFTICS